MNHLCGGMVMKSKYYLLSFCLLLSILALPALGEAGSRKYIIDIDTEDTIGVTWQGGPMTYLNTAEGNRPCDQVDYTKYNPPITDCLGLWGPIDNSLSNWYRGKGSNGWQVNFFIPYSKQAAVTAQLNAGKPVCAVSTVYLSNEISTNETAYVKFSKITPDSRGRDMYQIDYAALPCTNCKPSSRTGLLALLVMDEASNLRCDSSPPAVLYPPFIDQVTCSSITQGSGGPTCNAKGYLDHDVTVQLPHGYEDFLFNNFAGEEQFISNEANINLLNRFGWSTAGDISGAFKMTLKHDPAGAAVVYYQPESTALESLDDDYYSKVHGVRLQPDYPKPISAPPKSTDL